MIFYCDDIEGSIVDDILLMILYPLTINQKFMQMQENQPDELRRGIENNGLQNIDENGNINTTAPIGHLVIQSNDLGRVPNTASNDFITNRLPRTLPEPPQPLII